MPRKQNPAADGPRRCETIPRFALRSFKLREAKLQTTSLLVVRRSFSFKEWHPKTQDPSILHPVQAPARLSKENAQKPKGRNDGLRGAKPRLEISLWPPQAQAWIFLGPRKGSRGPGGGPKMAPFFQNPSKMGGPKKETKKNLF